MSNKIILSSGIFDKIMVIFIQIPKNYGVLRKKINEMYSLQWSATHKMWYIPIEKFQLHYFMVSNILEFALIAEERLINENQIFCFAIHKCFFQKDKFIPVLWVYCKSSIYFPVGFAVKSNQISRICT